MGDNRLIMIPRRTGPAIGVVCLLVVLISGCAVSTSVQPSIEITTVPPAEKGGGRELDEIKRMLASLINRLQRPGRRIPLGHQSDS